jgi:hypothetical protein
MIQHNAAELAARLGLEAEAVCRRYLSAGRRVGHYWQVGDLHNTPGRSLYVRLRGSASRPAGKWRDGSTGEYGDLLDIIQAACGLRHFGAVAEEARRFLALQDPTPIPTRRERATGGRSSAGAAARRLFAASQPIGGTLAETYLRHRGIAGLADLEALRFQPRCFYKLDQSRPGETWPAMIAAVTDLSGGQTGAHRTWLAPDGSGKAPVDTPRRAMGELLGRAVRFGQVREVLAAGEGIETVLSARMALPNLPMLAALSAAHLAAIRFPPALRRIYVLCDRDVAGNRAARGLTSRAESAGIEAIVLLPAWRDFNDDLRWRGLEALCANLRVQLRPDDASRFPRLDGTR